MSEMIKPMFEMIEVDETFGGGKGEEVFAVCWFRNTGKLFPTKVELASQMIFAELLKSKNIRNTSQQETTMSSAQPLMNKEIHSAPVSVVDRLIANVLEKMERLVVILYARTRCSFCW